MAESSISLWIPEQDMGVAAPIAPEARAMHMEDALRVALFDDSDNLLNELEVPPPKWRAREFFNEDGTMGWADSPTPFDLVLPADLPAARAEIFRRDWPAPFSVRVETEEEQPIIWNDDLKPDADFPIVLVSEFFSDADKFWKACEQFEKCLLGQRPFDEPEVAARVGVIGAFWPSGSKGRFDTRYYPDHRLYYGNHGKALRYARNVRETDFALVVIDSDKWAGAGGEKGREPAWASIADFHFFWPNMAIHELGHSFDLADEYSGSGSDQTYHGTEPNVSDRKHACEANWSELVSEGIKIDPTFAYGDAEPPNLPDDVVGSFEGAFYSDKEMYRPSYACCMRKTHDPFCPVCAETIRAGITGKSSIVPTGRCRTR